MASDGSVVSSGPTDSHTLGDELIEAEVVVAQPLIIQVGGRVHRRGARSF